MENEARDEKIDGPRVAARILNRMPPAKKKVLLERLAQTDPVSFQAISKDVVNFEDIATITDVGIQRLIKEIPHNQLVIALKSAPDDVAEALFNNMSSTKRKLVIEDLQSKTPIKISEIQEAQRQICIMMDRLRTLGAIVSRADVVE